MGAARRVKDYSARATAEFETFRKNEEGRFSTGPATRLAASPVANARSPWFFPAVALAFLASAVVYEARTSALQSFVLSRFAARISYKLGRGPSPSIVFPRRGPSDQRNGYARLPDILKRLQSQGFGVAEASLTARGQPHGHLRLLHRGPLLRCPHGLRPRPGIGTLRLYERPSGRHPEAARPRDQHPPGGPTRRCASRYGLSARSGAGLRRGPIEPGREAPPAVFRLARDPGPDLVPRSQPARPRPISRLI
jgi:hypothetical protein